MRTDLISNSYITGLALLILVTFTLSAPGQNKEEKQPPLKGLGSKLKQIKIPEGIGPKIPGVKNIFSEENKTEEEQEGRQDPDEEEKFDEDEEDPDKMMEKMIRGLGHDPDEVQRMMNEEGTATAADPKAIPEPDQKVLAGIKPTPKNENELLNYLKGFDNGADQALSADARKHASPHLNKGQQTKEAGYMLWMTGQQEAAAWLMLRAALADPKDNLLLSNLASVITMAGYADKSIPILEYLHGKNPQSSIVNNNLGQAWLSLGQVAKAKPFLEQAVAEYEQHPEANRSLARIAMKENNTALAKSHLKNALKGGFSQEAYYELKDMDPGRTVNMMDILRLDHKRNYKEIAVTKRFIMPAVPESIEMALKREQEITGFFHGLELTGQDLSVKYPPGGDKLFQGYETISRQMATGNRNLTSLKDVQKQYDLAAQIWNPFKIQAQEMLMAEMDDSYASSFNKRMKQLQQSREQQMKALEESLSADQRNLQSMEERLNKMESGEGESPAVQALERQICALRKQLFELNIEKSASINNAFVQEMESLAFQRLQEHTYWYTLYHLPQDPTELTYRLYAEYLNTLSGLKNSYPYPILAVYTGNGCEQKLLEPVTGNGKISKWEDTHCMTYWDLDFHFVKSKFTCKEATVGAKVYGVEFGGGQKYDPSTLDIVEHSVYFGGKIGKLNDAIGQTLASQVSAGVVTTVKFDGNWNIRDIIVKASAGAELGLKVPKSTDPNDSGLDIRQAASVSASTGYELSILSGFRGTGPKVSTVGNIFNR
jgi:tetratricopeptide (TPR) repeat protein